MRIRLTAHTAKLVEKNRKGLAPSAEVNRALDAFYSKDPAALNMPVITIDALKNLLGSTNVRRFLRTE